MASLSDLREGIAENLSNIVGLRVSSFVPDNPNPPMAVVSPQSIEYHKSFANGFNTYNFTVAVFVARVSERTAQNNLDAYCASTGSSSIKSAIESNRTLSGRAYDLMVSGMSNYGSVIIGDNTYLTAEFDCAVQAN
jgi:hypothetical protein